MKALILCLACAQCVGGLNPTALVIGLTAVSRCWNTRADGQATSTKSRDFENVAEMFNISQCEMKKSSGKLEGPSYFESSM